MKKIKMKFNIFLLLLTAFTAVAFSQKCPDVGDQIFKQFEWVIPDKLARSSAPHYDIKVGDKSQNMDDNAIKFLEKCKIKNVISLNEFRLPETAIMKLDSKKIKYLHLKVKDYDAPKIGQLRDAHKSYNKAQTTLVYCGFGHGRTGTAIAAFKLYEGKRYTRDQYRKLFHVETKEQCDVLDELAKEL